MSYTWSEVLSHPSSSTLPAFFMRGAKPENHVSQSEADRNYDHTMRFDVNAKWVIFSWGEAQRKHNGNVHGCGRG